MQQWHQHTFIAGAFLLMLGGVSGGGGGFRFSGREGWGLWVGGGAASPTFIKDQIHKSQLPAEQKGATSDKIGICGGRAATS